MFTIKKVVYICKVNKAQQNLKTRKMKTERFIVKKVVKFGMLFGYVVFDTVENKNTVFSYDEDELYKAKSKAELKNALNK